MIFFTIDTGHRHHHHQNHSRHHHRYDYDNLINVLSQGPCVCHGPCSLSFDRSSLYLCKVLMIYQCVDEDSSDDDIMANNAVKL